MTTDELKRYSRQTLLPEVGLTGQEKLKHARVLCVGAGGLGAPVLLYLASAGIGHIGIVDPDTVDISNLQRQVLFRDSDCGKLKAEVARQQLVALNPTLTVSTYPVALTAANAVSLLSDFDIVVDGTDNFAAKFLINDACVKLSKPLIHAAVTGFEGQLASFSGKDGPCYRCLYPKPPVAAIPNCAEAGVLGAVVGVLGSLQALATIQCILADYSVAESKLTFFDGHAQQLSSYRLSKRKDCAVCSISKDKIQLASETTNEAVVFWLDVRTPEEWSGGHIPHALNLPLDLIEGGRQPDVSKEQPIRVYCATGLRSVRAAARLKAAGFQNVETLELGLRQWTKPLVTDNQIQSP